MGNFFSCTKKPPEKPAITVAAAPPATTESPTPPSADHRSQAENAGDDDWPVDEAALDKLEEELSRSPSVSSSTSTP